MLDPRVIPYEREATKARASLSSIKATLALFGVADDTAPVIRGGSREVIELALAKACLKLRGHDVDDAFAGHRP